MTGFVASMALKAIAGSALSGAWGGVKGVGRWIGSLDLVHMCLLIACLFGAWQTVGRWAQHRHTVKVEGQLSKCTDARATDARNYAAAQDRAQADNLAHVAAENNLREQVNEASRHSFVSDRDRLRAQSGAPGAPGSAGLPQVPHAADGTPAEVLSLPAPELLRAQETELQLNALIDWVLKQETIDPNGAPKP